MSLVTDAFAPLHRPAWPRWLARELAPFPGRQATALRMVVAVVLVTTVSMALETPETALSAYMVFFATKENRVLTRLTGVLMILGVTLAIAATLGLYRFTFDAPELRIPVMAGMVFLGMYLSRVFIIGPLGFAIGFVIAVTQSAAELAPDADSLVRALLWLWMAVVFPIIITVVLNQILLPAQPWAAFARELTRRLEATAGVLRRVLRDGRAGGERNAPLLELASRGSGPVLTDLKFAGLQEPDLKRRHAALVSSVSASERLTLAAAMLEMRTPQPLSPADTAAAKELLMELEELKSLVQSPAPGPSASRETRSAPTLPELRDLALAAQALRQGITAGPSAAPEAPKEKKHLFVADALTNFAHARFALKVTLAAMGCYFLYTGLNWSGIHTAFITCCFIALENTGATLRKGWLRLIGCAVGGLLGFLSILYLVPHMESIVSLLLLTAAGALIAAWVAAGSERISYGGLQIGFAFFMCIFQGFAPATDFETIRDRLAGIVLGIVVSTAIFHWLWPERSIDRLRNCLAEVLRRLGQLIRIPQVDGPTAKDGEAATRLTAQTGAELDETLRQAELTMFEPPETGATELSPAELARATEYTQVLFLVATNLTGPAALEEWRRLSHPGQEADAGLRRQAAAQLEQAAIRIEQGKNTEPGGGVAESNKRPAPGVAGSDRARLLEAFEENIPRLA